MAAVGSVPAAEHSTAKIRRSLGLMGRFLLALSSNLLLQLRWSIPAWILLGLHIWLGISINWFIGALAFWILSVLTGMWFTGWAAKCGNRKDPPKENKNPYSSKYRGG